MSRVGERRGHWPRAHSLGSFLQGIPSVVRAAEEDQRRRCQGRTRSRPQLTHPHSAKLHQNRCFNWEKLDFEEVSEWCEAQILERPRRYEKDPEIELGQLWKSTEVFKWSKKIK